MIAAQVVTVSATAYCDAGRMADGTFTRPGSVASNRHPLGTRLRIIGRRIYGRRTFTSSCSTARQFGRQRVRYRVVS